MSRVLWIPDQHQRPEIFERIIHEWPDYADKIVFSGDIVDDWKSKEWWMDPVHNPLNAINKVHQCKELYGDKFFWLVGNHDLSYLPATSYEEERESASVSGHQFNHHAEISAKFQQYWDDMDACAWIDEVCYTHAGVSNIFVNIVLTKFDKMYKKSHPADEVIPPTVSCMPFADKVNELFHNPALVHECFDFSGIDSTGEDPFQTCVWIRPSSLVANQGPDKQVVGHTELEVPTLFSVVNGTEVESMCVVVDTPNHDQLVLISDGDLANYKIISLSAAAAEPSKQTIKKEFVDGWNKKNAERMKRLSSYFL